MDRFVKFCELLLNETRPYQFLEIFSVSLDLHLYDFCYNKVNPALDSGSNKYFREGDSALVLGPKLSPPTWLQPGV